MKNTDIVFVVPSAIPLLQEESIGTLILAKKLILSGYNVQIVTKINIKVSGRILSQGS